MSDQELNLIPTGREPVTFRGRVVAHAEGLKDDPKLCGRHHTITVYQATDGYFHLKIDFLTTCPDERDVTVIEDRVELQDIDTLLMQYEPTEHLCLSRSTSQSDASSRFKKALWRQFDSLTLTINKLLRDLEHRQPQEVKEISVGVKGGWSRWTSWLPLRN